MWGKGLITGLYVTMKNMLGGPVTLQYPEERHELPARARWAVRPCFFEDGTPKCTACQNCVRACPDGILHMEVVTSEDKTKRIACFSYEVGACMFCGLCVEACPFGALRMSHEYELATTTTDGLEEMLLEDVHAASARREAQGPEGAQVRPKTEAEEVAAEGSGDQPGDAAKTEGGADD